MLVLAAPRSLAATLDRLAGTAVFVPLLDEFETQPGFPPWPGAD